MRVITVTVGRKGPDDESRNRERLKAAEQALTRANELEANVIILPAGFFAVHNSKAREAIADSLICIAKRLGIGVVFGVDQAVKDISRNWESEIRDENLPFYAYAWSPDDKDSPYCWNQRSIDSNNQRFAPNESCRNVRLIRIGNETLGILICGEIFNPRILSALAAYHSKPNVIVDLAHRGQRFRVWQGMKKLAQLGFISLCSVHASCEYAIKYCYTPEKGRMSTRIPDASVYGPPRIELKLWSF